MSVTATPTLTVAGTAVPGSLAIAGTAVPGSLAGAPALVAVDELAVTWGRASVLEQPQAATARLTVLDRSAGATFARRTDLIGAVVVLGWTTGASSGTNFRGRITDVTVTPLPGAVAGQGFRVALSASSIEVDLANYKQPEGTVWPAETFAARRARIAAQIPSGLIGGGLNLPGRLDLGLQAFADPTAELDSYTAAQVDVSGQDVLALIRSLYASTSPLPAVYDPAGNRYTFPPRRVFTYSQIGLTASALLQSSPDHGGRYIAASLTGLHLDGHATEYAGSLTQQIDSRVTRVEVTYLDSTAAYASRTAAAATVNTGAESDIGRRTLSVSSIHATAANAQQLAGLYADVASAEGRAPRLGSIGYSSHREPLHDAAHAAALLAGAETSGTVFLGRTWLTQLGARPLVSLLGGEVTYSGGVWSVHLTPGPTLIDPRPFSWAPLTIAAAGTPGVRLRDVDPSVTFGDCGALDIGAGYTYSTATGYKGNPNP